MSKKPNKKKQKAKKRQTKSEPSQAAHPKSTFTPWRFGFRYEITPDGRRILHRKHYVFEGKVKKLFFGSFIVLIVALVLGSLSVAWLNQQKRDQEDEILRSSAANEQIVSLTGMSADARDMIEGTGKFDFFLQTEDKNDTAASVYDTVVTQEDADVLRSRNQIDGTGIIDVPKAESGDGASSGQAQAERS